MKKELRKEVYEKCGGKCGYCGKDIKFKDMQVDHMNPQCLRTLNMSLIEGVVVDKTDCIENLMPSCRRCNHYKRADTVEHFRHKMKTLHERINRLYINKVAIDFGIMTPVPFNGTFYFETLN